MNVAIVSSILTLLLHLLQSRSFDGGYEQSIQQWTDNARTNMTVETSAQFRDRVLTPFLRREMPNPFSPGGSESGKPWAKTAEKVYETGLRDIGEGLIPMWKPNHVNCRKAGELYELGCREPFISYLAGFDPDLYLRRDCVDVQLQRLGGLKCREPGLSGAASAPRTHASKTTFHDLLYTHALRRLGHTDREALAETFRNWLRSGNFRSDDEIALYHVGRSLLGMLDDVWKDFPDFQWAYAMDKVLSVNNEAVNFAGDGIRSTVTPQGWSALRDKRREAMEILDEAEALRPGRMETLSMRLYIDGNLRKGSRELRQRLFEEISAKRLDDQKAIKDYVWFNMYPRWGGDPQRRQMRRFAEACYETQRHDTLLPYFYAETMCRYVRDASLDPFKYFRRHPDVTDKCIDVCMRQTTNELACGYARISAPFVGAAVAYYAGRYEKAAEFAPYFDMPHYKLDDLFFHKEGVADAVKSFSGKSAQFCLKAQKLYDGGRYAELLRMIEGDTEMKQKDAPARCLLGTLELNARMRHDFPRGKDVRASVQDYLPGWLDKGWRAVSKRTWRTDDGFEWGNNLTWMAELPKEHELEFELAPKHGTDGRHVLVVSRCIAVEANHRPMNQIPFVTFIWESDCTRVCVGNDYYRMFKVDPSQTIAKPASDYNRKIRIAWSNGRLDVYVDGGDRPVLSTRAFASAIRRSPECGYARFRGEDVEISNIVVRKTRGARKRHANGILASTGEAAHERQ